MRLSLCNHLVCPFFHFVLQVYALSYYDDFLFSITTDIYLLYFNFMLHVGDVSAKRESRKVKYYSCFFLFHMLRSDCKSFICNKTKEMVLKQHLDTASYNFQCFILHEVPRKYLLLYSKSPLSS